jgi:catechol 2,3-dioxygenase-like lactoylglutathione lyase family enzyme
VAVVGNPGQQIGLNLQQQVEELSGLADSVTGMEQRLSLVTLGVTDLARSRAFYAALGWSTEAAPGDEIVFFQLGGMVLALWDRAALATDSAVTDSGGWGGATLAQTEHSPAEVDAVLAAAAAAGATIGRPAAETFWGGYSGVFLDPDGHPWEVAHNPFWTITSDGATLLKPPDEH